MFGKKKASEITLDDGAPPKKKPPIMIIVLAVVGVVVFTLTFVIGKKVAAKSKPKVAVVEKGPILELDEFLVNLADPGSDHFLKVTVDLELKKSSGKTAEGMKDDIPRMRDAVVTALSSKMRDMVSSDDGREKLKAEILSKVNASLGDPIITHVYFTNFVTQ